MTPTRRLWVSIISVLILAGSFTGCIIVDDDDDDDDGGCFLFTEQEPNDSELNAQILDNMFVGDCFVVDGSLFDDFDEDSYRLFVQEDLALVVTLDHSPLVDFDVLIFDADTGELISDCGVSVVPESCTVVLSLFGSDLAVDVVVVSAGGAGTYTLDLIAQ